MPTLTLQLDTTVNTLAVQTNLTVNGVQVGVPSPEVEVDSPEPFGTGNMAAAATGTTSVAGLVQWAEPGIYSDLLTKTITVTSRRAVIATYKVCTMVPVAEYGYIVGWLAIDSGSGLDYKRETTCFTGGLAGMYVDCDGTFLGVLDPGTYTFKFVYRASYIGASDQDWHVQSLQVMQL